MYDARPPSLSTILRTFTFLIVPLVFAQSAMAGSATWVGDIAGNWGDVAEWGGTTFPNGVGETATFTNAAFYGGGGTIILANSSGGDTDITIGTWSKSSSSGGRKVTLNNVASGTGKLIFEVSSGTASYNSSNQNSASDDVINVGIQLNSSLMANIGQATGGIITFNGIISEFGGVRSLTKTGAGVLELAGGSANTFSGGVLVQHGSLLALKNGALGSGNITVGEVSETSTASLTIGASVLDSINDSASLYLTSFTGGTTNFATLNLSLGVNETIGALYFDGAMQSAGTWGATGSGADFTNDDWFTGSGVLTVVPEPGIGALIALAAAAAMLPRRRRVAMPSA